MIFNMRVFGEIFGGQLAGTHPSVLRAWLRGLGPGGGVQMTTDRAVMVLRLAGRRVTAPRCLAPRCWQVGLRPFVSEAELVAMALRVLPEIRERWA